jgi:hypothetical protein
LNQITDEMLRVNGFDILNVWMFCNGRQGDSGSISVHYIAYTLCGYFAGVKK